MHIVLVAIISFLFVNASTTLKAFSPCTNGAIRLVDGLDELSGRVEVCFNNQWGTVCASNNMIWTQANAEVICKQLGYSDTGAIVPDTGYFGQGEGLIHLSNINCTGNENHITECHTSLIGEHKTCNHDNDVAVICQDGQFTCTDGNIRLSGPDMAPHTGRVEICYGNQYGTVCDDHWDNNDANVVCRQLGYSGNGAIALGGAAYGAGYGQIYLDDVNCDGDEPNISQCGHVGVSDSNCKHTEDASVICKPNNPKCEDGEIRLVNGRIASEGRVEICHNGIWGTICHDLWDDKDAGVVCSQLGYTSEDARAVKYADFREGEGVIFLDDVQCGGSEKFLNECSSNPLAVHNCGHNKDVGVICKDPSFTCANGDIRLVNSSIANAGRVEICYNNHYGTVCNDDWTTEDANVVCGQLGYEKYGSVAISNGYYGNGVGMIYLDNVNCNGDEDSLLNCIHNDIGNSNCYHHQDAAVICKRQAQTDPLCNEGDVRLVSGSSSNEGVVEICINEVWSRVCSNGWDSLDAKVVCRELQSKDINKSIAVSKAGKHYHFNDTVTAPVLFTNISCNGSEGDILNCRGTSAHYLGYTECPVTDIAGVICSNDNPDCQDGDVRLVGGVSSNQGRVEVCYNGIWGTVCNNDTWTQAEATVVCQQLGYNITQTRPIPVSGGSFGIGTGPVYLSNVHCYGNEHELHDCIGATFDYYTCSRSMEVGVVCAEYPNPCVNGEMRLASGNHGNQEGRVEVCIDGDWKMMCIENMESKHVQQICTSITGIPMNTGSYGLPGLFASVATSVGGAISGSTTDCTSDDILQCIKDTFIEDITTCGRHNSIGVICTANDECKSGDVRLIGGANEHEGRVEVCIGGQWGTVCDDGWDNKAANVVCNQLGYTATDEVMAVPGGYYDHGNGEIFLDNIQCNGMESDLLQCKLLSGIKEHNCNHREDAGVKCQVNVPVSTDEVPSTNSNVGIGYNNETGSTATPCIKENQNINTNIILPIAAMTTGSIFIICITIISVLVFKWRRLKLIDNSSNKKESDIVSDRTSSTFTCSPSHLV